MPQRYRCVAEGAIRPLTLPEDLSGNPINAYIKKATEDGAQHE